MSRKNLIYKRGYEHTDFTDLLSELRADDNMDNNVGNDADNTDNTDSNADNNTDVAAEGTALASDMPVVGASIQKEALQRKPIQRESENRHRIMSDQKIKYLYSKHEGIIHEKHCECAKEIPDEDIGWSEEYITELRPCSECMIQAYITAGAKDSKEIDRYQQFFEKTKMTEKQIRSIYVENGMKTRIFPDAMTVWHREDTWRIKTLPKKGHVQLYHNNYVIREKGVREFTQGFHIQNITCEDTNIGYALSIIKNYEYKPEEYALHSSQVNLSRQKKVRQKQIDQMDHMNQEALPLEDISGDGCSKQTIWQRIGRFFCKIFKTKGFFERKGFEVVAERGYPKDQTICIYVWENKNGKLSWQTGIYNKKWGKFFVRYGMTVYSIEQDRVIAWKKMTSEAVELDVWI